MRILHAAAECYPFLKTGGLADVVAALPAAQRREGEDARILLPGFPAVMAQLVNPVVAAELPGRFGAWEVKLWLGSAPDTGVPVYAIDAPGLFDRPGNPYEDANHQPYPDNHRRFALLSWVAAHMAIGGIGDWRPEILHAHDWHAGLAPAYLSQASEAVGRRLGASVTSVHNLAYQGNFWAERFAELGLRWDYFGVHGVEFNRQVSFLKAALYFSHKITTVSPNYAQEIQTPEHGWGLDGLLRSRRGDLWGILNGVDYSVWNPAKDPALPARYDANRLAGKARCKAALQTELGLEVNPDKVVFAVVSRFAEQKGLHLAINGAWEMLRRGGQLVVLGNGEWWVEDGFRRLANEHPTQVAVRFSFDEALSHRIYGGADVVVVPSRFEPCGLTQLYGLRYGTLPLVRRTGGLADTVVDCALENLGEGTATGFVFDHMEQSDYDAAVRRAFALFARPPMLKEVRKRGMGLNFDWQESARQYINLYRTT